MSEWKPCDGCPRPYDCPSQRHKALCKRLAEDRAKWLPTIMSDPPGPRHDPPLPSKAHMAGELIKTAANVVVEAVTTGKFRASPEEQERRWSICRECDHFRASDARCGKNDGCGCWLAQAIIVSAKQCPVGKW